MATTIPVAQSTGLIPLLGLMLLAGVAACGPAPSDQAPSLESRASVAGPGNRSEASGTGREANQGEARPEQPVGVPAWMAPAQESPDVQERLRALETWAQQPRTGSVDPLLLAVDDPDARVRATAFALLDDDMGRELAAEEAGR